MRSGSNVSPAPLSLASHRECTCARLYLGRWLEEAKASSIKELQSLATGIYRDFDAVRAALATKYSNGQTEGKVNKLKCIKRQMYGRAKFDLLRQRMLLCA